MGSDDTHSLDTWYNSPTQKHGSCQPQGDGHRMEQLARTSKSFREMALVPQNPTGSAVTETRSPRRKGEQSILGILAPLWHGTSEKLLSISRDTQ